MGRCCGQMMKNLDFTHLSLRGGTLSVIGLVSSSDNGILVVADMHDCHQASEATKPILFLSGRVHNLS
jgi:hypothetical protein